MLILKDPNYYKIDNEVRLEELEVQNRDLKRDLDEMRYKFDNEKMEREKVRDLKLMKFSESNKLILFYI